MAGVHPVGAFQGPECWSVFALYREASAEVTERFDVRRILEDPRAEVIDRGKGARTRARGEAKCKNAERPEASSW
ncbi:MAG: hypothetical protein Rubg2KO_35360 [Rubricoccaceae bacterium]